MYAIYVVRKLVSNTMNAIWKNQLSWVVSFYVAHCYILHDAISLWKPDKVGYTKCVQSNKQPLRDYPEKPGMFSGLLIYCSSFVYANMIYDLKYQTITYLVESTADLPGFSRYNYACFHVLTNTFYTRR